MSNLTLRGSSWRELVDHSTTDEFFCHVPGADGSGASDNWKIHISSTIRDCDEILERSLPVLRAARFSFKVVKDRETLARFNSGELGYTQIGKFITIYLSDADSLVELCASLMNALRGFEGPRVPSDENVPGTGCLFYRFVEASSQFERQPGKALRGATRDPFGEAQDDRQQFSRYRDILPVASQQMSGKGIMFTAIDLESDPPRTLFAKRYFRFGCMELDGTDAVARGRWHAKCLQALAGRVRVPRLVREYSHFGDWIVLEEKVTGTTVDTSPSSSAAFKRATIRNLVMQVSRVHAAGLIVNDLSAKNVLVDGRAQCTLVDFDRALGGGSPPRAPGTPGFQCPDPAYMGTEGGDYYSLGSIARSLDAAADDAADLLAVGVPADLFERGYRREPAP